MATLRNIGVSLLAAAALSLPAAAKTKAKAEVTCADGTTSKAGRGACSHHGGVEGTATADKSAKSSSKNKTRAELDEAKKKSQERSGGILDKIFGRKKADTAQGRGSTATPRSSTRENRSGKPTARCKDGTTSYSAHHSGTCSNHGGVAQWLDE
jgi:hypothetical protein